MPTFTLKKSRAISDVFLGKLNLPVTNINSGNEIHATFDIMDESLNVITEGLQFHVKVQFTDVTADLNWDCGIKTPKYPGVPYTFFTQKALCRVTMYQDAHVDNTFVPNIPLSGEKNYEQHGCWKDIFDAITNAQKLIYTKITLIRDPTRPRSPEDMTLGELLKKKAEEGVRVLMLVWNDSLSMMGTHDKETYNYFKDSGVYCVLCPRNPDGNAISLIAYSFTHHQKTVVVDSALPNGSSNLRRIVSFVGGIDLCDGRYDTQSHSLFRTLSTVHHDDFYQHNFKDASINKGGPREPWHDIHCRLEGPSAWDVLENYEQRWKKQGLNEKFLVNVEKDDKTFIPRSRDIFPDDGEETLNVQVFRSIDSEAASGFPDSPENTAAAGLLRGKNGVIDRSIQDAYIHAIRRAKRFIYIENQYFIGSAFDWQTKSQQMYGQITAFNLIPKELSLKITSKIEKDERFTVYIVLPMWPEGEPEGNVVQDVLRWQRETMQMMYTDVTKAS